MKILFNFLSVFLAFTSLIGGARAYAEDAKLPTSASSSATQTPHPVQNENGQWPKQILNLSSDERIITNALLADKSQRILSLIDQKCFSEGTVKEKYTIDIGKNNGDKKKRDDARTPEGIYVLLERKLPPEIPFDTYGSMAFTTNYPNYFDRFDKKTGSGIWLHSVPDTVPLTRGSRGCVVLRNNDIKKIESSIKLKKTFLVIDSKIKWVSNEEHNTEKAEALKWLENWRAKWESQDIDSYIDNYSDEFRAPPYNKKTWYKHKSDLKNKYKYVKVQFSEPNILQVKKNFLFQFVQNYESDGHKDIGIKTLYVIKEGNALRIAREDWSPL